MSETTGQVEDGGSPWDAIVLGAGPSGAIAARELASAGASVLLVDRRSFPRDKVCGGCLNGHTLAVLRSAGLEDLPARAGALPLGAFRLGIQGRELRLVLPAGLVVSRPGFDAELVAAAVSAGARFLPETEGCVGALEGEARQVRLRQNGRDRTVRARVVLVATGLAGSALQELSDIQTRVAAGSRIGVSCLVPGCPDYSAGTIHMAVGTIGYVGLVRLGHEGLHIAAAFGVAGLRRAGGPGGAARLVLEEAGFPPIDGLAQAHWLGTPGLTRRTYPVGDTRIFVLGDAAGYVEPFTGEGIAWALASGRAVAAPALAAIRGWQPGYGREWGSLYRRVVGRRQMLCRAATFVLRRPALARLVCQFAVRVPASANLVLDLLNAPPVLEGVP